MVNQMVIKHKLTLIKRSIQGNSRMGKNKVKEHTLNPDDIKVYWVIESLEEHAQGTYT